MIADPNLLHALDQPRVTRVRPGLFLAGDTAGVAIPVEMNPEAQDGRRWAFVVVHRDGGRELLAKLREIKAADGSITRFNSPHLTPTESDFQNGWYCKHALKFIQGENVDPKAVVERTLRFIQSRLWFPPDIPGVHETILCFALTTYIPGLPSAPYLHFNAPKGCGKSTAISTVSSIARAPITTANGTPASVFRMLNTIGGTLLYDEAESLQSGETRDRELRGLLLAGHKPGSMWLRCRAIKDNWTPEEYHVFGPKVLAGIDQLDSVLGSRCITIQMVRRPLDAKTLEPIDTTDLRDDIHSMALAHVFDIVDQISTPQLDAVNRDLDVWNPIVAIANWIESKGLSGFKDRVLAYRDYLLEQQDEDEDERRAIDILTVFLELVKTGQNRVTITTVLQYLENRFGDRWRGWNPREVGQHVTSLGFTAKRSGGKRLYRLVESQIRKTADSRGLPLPQDS